MRIICTLTHFVLNACKNCVLYAQQISYAHENRILYARQQISNHMHAKVHFCYQHHEFLFIFWRSIYMHFHEIFHVIKKD